MKSLAAKYLKFSDGVKDVPLLLMRIALAYGLYGPAVLKWGNIDNVASWFGQLGIPLPKLNAYMSATVEMAGVILLPLGLFTRIISFMLIIVMIVAVATVHWKNGFAAGDNGYEIPLYYMLMFMLMHWYGAGRWSVDHFLFPRRKS